MPETDLQLPHPPRVSTSFPTCTALRFLIVRVLNHITDLVQTKAVKVLRLRFRRELAPVSVADLTLLLPIRNMFVAQHSFL